MSTARFAMPHETRREDNANAERWPADLQHPSTNHWGLIAVSLVVVGIGLLVWSTLGSELRRDAQCR